MNKSLSGTSGFGLVFDNLLERDTRQTWRDLVLISLLYAEAVISDSWAFTNRGMIGVLTARKDSHLLLRNGALRIARRDSLPNFVAVEEKFRADKMHALTGDAAYAAMLDEQTVDQIVLFPGAKVGQNYVAMASRVLQPEFLVSLGVSLQGAETVGRLVAEASARGEKTSTNTFVKDQICPHLDAADAALVMDIARAPYGLNLPILLGTGIQGPLGYTGDRVLSALRGAQRVGSLLVSDSTKPDLEGAFSAALTDPAIRALFTPANINMMTPEDLIFLRSVHATDREEYLTALQAYLSGASQVTFDALRVSMERYFRKVGTMLIERWLSDGSLTGAPTKGSIEIHGDGSLKIILPDSPVQLSGVTKVTSVTEIALPMADGLTIVGRTIAVPASDTAA